MIPYGRQEITQEDIDAVVEVLRSDYLTQGPQVELFEKEFAESVGVPHAIAVNNGTSALHLAALALGVGPGQKVLCPSNTFAASSNAILYCGGDVEFVDIDPTTLCLDLNHVEEKLKKGQIKGIVAVDFAGYPIVREELFKLTRQFGVWIIEDACHAVGARYQDGAGSWQTTGSGLHADITVFSFHPVKHITTGEGGMLTTRNDKLAHTIRRLRTHGITKDPKEMPESHGGWYMEMQDLGYNYRIPDVLCALGRTQLKRLKTNIENRQAVARRYNEGLASLPIKLPLMDKKVVHAFHLYVIQTEKRKELYDDLRKKNILTQVHYIPVHHHPYYKKRYGMISLPRTEEYYRKTLSLPMYHSLTESDQKLVIEGIKKFYE